MKKATAIFWVRQMFVVWACVFAPLSLQADELDELIALQKKIRALEGVGRYQDAIPFAQQSLMIAEKAFANNPKNLAIATNDLAILYKAMGNNT